jgi:hypothetical protein
MATKCDDEVMRCKNERTGLLVEVEWMEET